MKTVLYMHGGSGNHGCEALVRTTSKIVKKNIGGKVVLWSFAVPEDWKYGVNDVVDHIVSTDEVNLKSLSGLIAYVKYKLSKERSILHKAFMRGLFHNAIAISIGGDNYCYTWSAKQGAEVDREIRECSRKNIFWGCSIDKDSMTPEILDDLKGFDLITVRESLSLQVLEEFGISATLVADPAFLLPIKETLLPKGFIEGNTVGINISPMINSYESEKSAAFENYLSLIEYVLNCTDMTICLIPHVVWKQTNDFMPIRALYERFVSSGRVVIAEDRNCEELKGIISKCRFFVGARTHSTIAAYSSCVPTLVVGYSIKSKGIATDLFGTYENYVIPVQDMKKPGELVDAFVFIMKNEEQIRNRLKLVIPEMKKKAELAGRMLSEVVQN